MIACVPWSNNIIIVIIVIFIANSTYMKNLSLASTLSSASMQSRTITRALLAQTWTLLIAYLFATTEKTSHVRVMTQLIDCILQSMSFKLSQGWVWLFIAHTQKLNSHDASRAHINLQTFDMRMRNALPDTAGPKYLVLFRLLLDVVKIFFHTPPLATSRSNAYGTK